MTFWVGPFQPKPFSDSVNSDEIMRVENQVCEDQLEFVSVFKNPATMPVPPPSVMLSLQQSAKSLLSWEEYSEIKKKKNNRKSNKNFYLAYLVQSIFCLCSRTFDLFEDIFER